MPDKITPDQAREAARAMRLAADVTAAILNNLADAVGDDGKVDFSEVVTVVLAAVSAVGENL